MRTSHESYYLTREKVVPCEIPANAVLHPLTGEKIGELFKELGGRRPSVDRLYTWRSHGFVVKRKSDCRAVTLPVVVRSGRPMTTPAAVRAFWKAAVAEAKRVGVNDLRI